MVSINTDGRVHASFIENFPGTAFPEIRFWPYSEGSELVKLRHAIHIITVGIFKKNHMCNQHFNTMPKGRSFDDIFGSASTWINFEPRSGVGFMGATSILQTPPVDEITIAADTFARNVWVVAATIIHELAHVNGVPGGTGMTAEDSLKHCGMAAHWSSSAVGQMDAYNEFFENQMA